MCINQSCVLVLTKLFLITGSKELDLMVTHLELCTRHMSLVVEMILLIVFEEREKTGENFFRFENFNEVTHDDISGCPNMRRLQQLLCQSVDHLGFVTKMKGPWNRVSIFVSLEEWIVWEYWVPLF